MFYFIAMISREEYLNSFSLITKLCGQRISYAKTNLFSRTTKAAVQEGENGFFGKR